MASVVILGPAYPLRGGIAAFNERLARELLAMGHQVVIYSFSLQYPSFLFPGKTQLSEGPPPEDLDIRIRVNTLNPLSWYRTAREIRARAPQVVITRFWIPFMAPALGSILRRVKKGGKTRIVCIADNVIPHEKRPGDAALTKYFLGACDRFIAMSRSVLKDLQKLSPAPATLIPHPLYDHFGSKGDKRAAREKLGLDPDGKWLLFFGFIRGYKGLDLLMEALADPEVRREEVRLVVAGEFYEPEAPYLKLLTTLGLKDAVVLHTHFIRDDQVQYYFSAADAITLPYRSATQSGIAPMAYHFERPMIATGVGGLPETIPDGVSGVISAPDAASLARAILRFYRLGEEAFSPGLASEKQKYSWRAMAEAVMAMPGAGTEV